MSVATAIHETTRATGEAQQRMAVLSLWGLTQEWASIQDALCESGGEITPEIEAALEALPGALEAKAEGYVHIIRQFELAAEAAKAEAERLGNLARVRSNAAARLKQRLKDAMESMGLPKIETDRCRVRIQKNGRPTIAWEGEPDALPMEFAKTVVSLDGAAAYNAWKAEGTLPEGFKVTEGTHLRIS